MDKEYRGAEWAGDLDVLKRLRKRIRRESIKAKMRCRYNDLKELMGDTKDSRAPDGNVFGKRPADSPGEKTYRNCGNRRRESYWRLRAYQDRLPAGGGDSDVPNVDMMATLWGITQFT